MAMTSSRPYMVRALYEWIVDNQCTPYLLVDAHGPGVSVPQEYVNEEGQIVLNVAPSAVQGLVINNEGIEFNARFGGVPTDIYIPCLCVLGVYARENGQGMIFDPEAAPLPEPPPKGSSPDGVTEKKRPSLKVIK